MVSEKSIKLPVWVTCWALIGSTVCIWDATYVLTRPRSMKNGDLFDYFRPYAKYITLDPLYGDLKNGFVVAQSWINLVEIALTFLSLFIYYVIGRKNFAALLLLVASVMTWSKTVLYFVHDHFARPSYPKNESLNIAVWEYIFLFIIPSLVWIVFPFASMWTIGRQILENLEAKTKKN